jgi:hypothetical protein
LPPEIHQFGVVESFYQTNEYYDVFFKDEENEEEENNNKSHQTHLVCCRIYKMDSSFCCDNSCVGLPLIMCTYLPKKQKILMKKNLHLPSQM